MSVVSVVWHDPGVLQREIWLGTFIVIASVAFSLFSLYSVVIRRWLTGIKRYVVIAGAWLVLFTVQLAYLSSHYVVIYGVLYNETSGVFEYAVTTNPMWLPVLVVTMSTAVVSLGALIIAYVRDYYSRMIRLAKRLYVEYY